MTTLVVLIVAAVMVATTQVAANVEAQLLCAVDSIGAEGGETSCGEAVDERGPQEDEDLADLPDPEPLRMYQIEAGDGQIYDLELSGGNEFDLSLANLEGEGGDPDGKGVNDPEEDSGKGVNDPEEDSGKGVMGDELTCQ
ncbi:hypothetical protein [Promicromonospora sp. NPDC023987]|uniref:hypothetical protein n=1 Tax=Promicromonospora sp. NPDC023987 TaxID=3155360 RepID=UPI0033C98D1F